MKVFLLLVWSYLTFKPLIIGVLGVFCYIYNIKCPNLIIANQRAMDFAESVDFHAVVT